MTTDPFSSSRHGTAYTYVSPRLRQSLSVSRYASTPVKQTVQYRHRERSVPFEEGTKSTRLAPPNLFDTNRLSLIDVLDKHSDHQKIDLSAISSVPSVAT